MDQNKLTSALSSLPLWEIQYFDTIGSTNDQAMAWVKSGAADSCLVVAEHQTNGRGRMGRKWISSPDSSLTFSLILFPKPEEARLTPLFSPLASLAIAETLTQKYGLKNVNVKWPNDVLIDGKKTAGILAESTYVGNRAQVVVVGVGINVGSGSVPPADQLLFPATCVEDNVGTPIDRLEFLKHTLKFMLDWRKKITTPEFIEAWDHFLAFRGETVFVQQSGQWSISGILSGIDKYGNLRIKTSQDAEVSVAYGDVSLRPSNNK